MLTSIHLKKIQWIVIVFLLLMYRDHIVLTSWRRRQTPESMVIDDCVSVCSVKPDSYLVSHLMNVIISYLTLQSQRLVHVIDCLIV